MKNLRYYSSPIGSIGLAEENNAITDLFFGDDPLPGSRLNETPLLKAAFGQLQEYLEGGRKAFELSLNPHGSEFFRKVWKALEAIPYGQTRSYGHIAAEIGQPKACRAVGLANNRNPIAIIIPCHRVIGADGRLVGYGGGLHIKEYLLDLEKKS